MKIREMAVEANSRLKNRSVEALTDTKKVMTAPDIMKLLKKTGKFKNIKKGKDPREVTYKMFPERDEMREAVEAVAKLLGKKAYSIGLDWFIDGLKAGPRDYGLVFFFDKNRGKEGRVVSG